jgi:hypothetical protein
MNRLPILISIVVLSPFGAVAVARPAAPKAWFEEVPNHEARPVDSTRHRVDNDRQRVRLADERIRADEASLARAEQRMTDTRGDWNRSDTHWFGWPDGPAAERHHVAVVERNRLQTDLFRAQDERVVANADELAARRLLERERALEHR